MDQQDQTLQFFKSHASDWQTKATDQVYSVIENRHKAVLETMRAFPQGSSLLDIGCGTGQLAIQASQLGWRATGLDFAQEMIDQCRVNNAAAQAGAEFACASVFDYKPAPGGYDVLSAQGFIEYVSLPQLEQFLAFVFQSLRPGGRIALGSRNRLFNLHALNDFTELETALGTIADLTVEARILQGAGTQEEAVAALSQVARDYPQPTHHPITGIKVDTRYQFSPADLIGRLQRAGLVTTRVFPVHYHPLPVSLLSDPEFKATHLQFARHASDHWIVRHNLVPYASSFVIEARKP